MVLSATVVRQLEEIVGKDNVSTAKEDLLCYSYDAGPLFTHLPDILVRPRTPQEISKILILANR